MLTRRQFFSRMRNLGFSKSRIQMARNGLTYQKGEGTNSIMVTVPKWHEETFTITGNVSYSGIFREQKNGDQVNWGIPVRPNDLGMDNMLEVCLGLCSGEVSLQKGGE